MGFLSIRSRRRFHRERKVLFSVTVERRLTDDLPGVFKSPAGFRGEDDDCARMPAFASQRGRNLRWQMFKPIP